MLDALLPPRYLDRYSGGSMSREGSSSASFDYSGLDEHVKAQHEVDNLRAQKYAALYGGDVAGSVAASDKIRSLLKVINANVPGATERNPHTVTAPLARTTSTSSSSSVRADAPDYAGHNDEPPTDQEEGGMPKLPEEPEWKKKLRWKNLAEDMGRDNKWKWGMGQAKKGQGGT